MASQQLKLASQEPKISPQDSKLASQGPKFTAHEPKLSSKEPNIATQEPKLATQETKVTSQEPELTRQLALPSKYSNRVVLKTILERIDGGLGLVGERMVIGGWVKSSKEVIKEPISAFPPPQPEAYEGRIVSPGPKEVRSCAEILQCRIPLLRSIMKIMGGTGVTGGINHPMIRDKLEPEAPLRQRPSIAYLLVGDGSCVAGLQLMVESSIAFPCQLLPIGTCVVAEGVLRHSSEQRKHNLELKVEKILHIGTVEQDTYPLSKKRVPLESLRDCPHFRPRTTTVASVMRIRSALTFATHTFFQNHGYLCVQVPIITTTDAEGFSEKFQVTTSLGKEAKTAELNSTNDIDGASLEVVKAAVREKSNLVEELKRTDSNREALAAALQDLQKTNKLVTQLEAREKLKPASSVKADKVYMSEDFFPHHTYLNVSGLLHLESFACALGNVYSFGPRFQANRKESAKQVAEMWMVEVQMAFSQLEDSLSCASDYFKYLCKWVLENCSEDMKFVTKRIDRSSIDRLQSIISGSHEKISYMEAVDILKKVTDRVFETKLEWGVALTAEHLSYLADERYKRPIIIYNYPKEVKPFYVRLNSDGKTVAAFDMVLPKVGTFITGSQSEERANILDTRIKELGLAREQYEWYLDLRRHGAVKHSGFSLGFDLMVLFATGLSDVRDTIPFPRSYGKASS